MKALRWSLVALLVSPLVQAEGRTLTPEPFGGKKVTIDGRLLEWPGQMTSLGDVIEGATSGGDPRASAQLAYDDRFVYLALKVVDDKLVRTESAGAGEDHATLLVAFPKPGGGFVSHEVDVYPGDPGKLAGVVKSGGAAVRGAKVVESPEKSGYAFEAAIPWATFAEASHMRVGLRAAVQFTDADAPGRVKARIATAPSKAASSLPPLPLEGEQGLDESFLRDKGLSATPAREAYGNVSGDAMYERVAQYGAYLTIVGPAYKGGKQYYFGELGVSEASKLLRLELRDIDGDGHDEIVLYKRLGDSDKYRENVTILRIGANEAPTPIFGHETAIVTPDGKVKNELRFVKKGKGVAIEIAQGEASGFDPGTYREPTPGDMPSALLPWESVKSRTFAWDGSALTKAGEEAQTPKQGSGPKKGKKKAKTRPADDGPPAPPAPRPPSADELLDRLYALYRKERGVGESRPRFDFVTDVAGDGSTDRVLIHQKDIVVFGKGYLGGLKYAYITVGVADPKDILDATARDLTGDGKAEIIVRAVLHAKASKELGGDVVDRHALFIYQATDAGVKRIFAGETGRSLGDKRISAAVAFLPLKRGYSIELRSGRAVGWTEKSYPFPVDTTPAGGLEPLLYPWSEKKSRAYAFDGNAFAAR